MTILNSIEISNIRRFAPSTTIDFGPGLTILLAPNGTGKTAIIEAIELALTGDVARLEKNMDPLIRDNQSAAKVILKFGDETRSISLMRGKPGEVSGSIKNLLADVDEKDLPYLLRLTHLLDQRDGNWFVQANSNDAGSQLARLPIGRDIAVASAALAGARRSTRGRQEAEQKLGRVVESYKSWKDLLVERDGTEEITGRPLLPISIIFSQIAAMANNGWASPVPEINNLDSAGSILAEFSIRLDRHVNLLNNRKYTLGSLVEIVAQYESALLAQKSMTELYVKVSNDKNLIVNNLKLATEAFEKIEAERARLSTTRASLVEYRRKSDALDYANAEFVAKELSLSTAKEAFELAVRLRDEAKIKLETQNKIISSHQVFRRREQELANSKEDFQKLLSEIANLETLENELIILNRVKTELVPQLAAKELEYQNVYRAQLEYLRKIDDANYALKSLNAASDSIRSAVSIIASNLSKERSSCPLCGVNHGPDELQRRVTIALNTLDPALGPATQYLRGLEGDLFDVNVNLKKLSQEIDEYKSNILRYEKQQQQITENKNDIINNMGLYGATPQEASNTIVNKLSEIDLLQRGLLAERAVCQPIPSIENIQYLSRALSDAESAIEPTHSRYEEAKASHVRALEQLEQAKSVVEKSGTYSDFANQSKQLEESLTITDQLYEDARANKEQLQNQLRDASHQVAEQASSLEFCSRRVQELQAVWSDNELDLTPNKETLLFNQEEIDNHLVQASKDQAALEALRIEVSRHQSLNHRVACQARIDSIRGGVDEVAYSAKLESELAGARNELNRIAQGIGCFESLTTAFESSLSDIHEQVKAIQPQWQSLLSRVVREPRFGQIELDFYSHYRKEHAEVKVPLHGSTTSVRSVASEAQIADLQLTFLLAMALEKSWSPWRALLLDDPTQHHDLVHASAVFDLLRDLVSEHNFQIMFATHDALQARFFLRKMRNDGLAAKICSLQSTSDGVRVINEIRAE